VGGWGLTCVEKKKGKGKGEKAAGGKLKVSLHDRRGGVLVLVGGADCC